MDMIEALFHSNKPIALIIFAGLLVYVIHDLLKKSSRMDTLIEKVTSISNSLMILTSDFQKEQKDGEKTEEKIKDLQKSNGKISHRLARIETRLQLKDIQDQDH